jgi:hypothetical protein
MGHNLLLEGYETISDAQKDCNERISVRIEPPLPQPHNTYTQWNYLYKVVVRIEPPPPQPQNTYIQWNFLQKLVVRIDPSPPQPQNT